MPYHLYLLRCADDTLYTGITTDLDRRLHEHNHTAAGARYTRARRPVTLLISWPFPDRSEASKAEYRLKKRSRADKLALIDGSGSP